MPPMPIPPLDLDSLLWLIVLGILLYIVLNFLRSLTDNRDVELNKNINETMNELLNEIRKLRVEIEELRKELNE